MNTQIQEAIKNIEAAANYFASEHGQGRYHLEAKLRDAGRILAELSNAAEAVEDMQKMNEENVWLFQKINEADAKRRSLERIIKELRRELRKETIK